MNYMKKFIMLVLCLIPLICFAPIVSEKQQKNEAIRMNSNMDLIKYLSVRLDENLDSNFPIRSPLKTKDVYRISDLYGWRLHPISRKSILHYGIDFSAYTGTNIYATANGTVTETGWISGYGNQITINHGNGYETKYAHLSKINVNINDTIRYGEIIGHSGNTGISTGPSRTEFAVTFHHWIL